jgi:hypothetical protein
MSTTNRKVVVNDLNAARKKLMREANKDETAAERFINIQTTQTRELACIIEKHGARSNQAKIKSEENVSRSKNIIDLQTFASAKRQVAERLLVDCAANRTLDIMTEVTTIAKNLKQITSTAGIIKSTTDFKTSIQQLGQSTKLVSDTMSSMSIADSVDAENLINDTEKEIDEDIQIKFMRLKSVPLTEPTTSNGTKAQTIHNKSN